jgi:DNA polymerase III subunit delta'
MSMENSKIIGHERVLSYLNGAIERNRISHAYLFIGAKHLGKETVARWFGKKLISNPQAIARNLIVMRPEEGLKITDIRSLQHELSLKNPWGEKRVVLMGDVNDMNGAAQNAFLKLLEEPPVGVVFILLASSLREILPTIISRTQLVRFSLVSEHKIKSFLRERVSSRRAEELSRLACGKPGWAAVALNTKQESSVLETAADEFLKIFNCSVTEKFKLVRQLVDSEEILPLDSWESVWRDILLCQLGLEHKIVLLSLQSSIKKVSGQLDKSLVLKALRGIQELRQGLRSNINTKLLLENYFICYS